MQKKQEPFSSDEKTQLKDALVYSARWAAHNAGFSAEDSYAIGLVATVKSKNPQPSSEADSDGFFSVKRTIDKPTYSSIAKTMKNWKDAGMPPGDTYLRTGRLIEAGRADVDQISIANKLANDSGYRKDMEAAYEKLKPETAKIFREQEWKKTRGQRGSGTGYRAREL